MIAHAADGNFHFVHVVDPDDPDDVAAAQDLASSSIGRSSVGHSTGEHGVGVGKIDTSSASTATSCRTCALKQVFDPNGILNPGKVVREEVGA